MTSLSLVPSAEKSTTDRLFPQLRASGRVPLAASLPAWLAGRWAATLFATPRAAEPTPAEHAFLSTGESLSVHGLAAWRWGLGPAVFLAHGWEGFGAQLGAFVSPLVKAGYSVVAFDAKAHGASAGVEATLSDFADALLSVEARFGRPAAVIAHSFGALGTLLALRRGLAPRAVVLISIPSPKFHMAVFRKELGLSDAATSKLLRIVEKRVGVSFEGVEGPALATGLTVPALVVHDRRDRLASRETAEATVSALPHAAFHTTEGLGHYRILKDPGVVAEVTSFVTANAGAAGARERAIELVANDDAAKYPKGYVRERRRAFRSALAAPDS